MFHAVAYNDGDSSTSSSAPRQQQSHSVKAAAVRALAPVEWSARRGQSAGLCGSDAPTAAAAASSAAALRVRALQPLSAAAEGGGAERGLNSLALPGRAVLVARATRANGAAADLAVALPPGVRLAPGRAGRPDVRVQLLDVKLEWRRAAFSGDQQRQRQQRQRQWQHDEHEQQHTDGSGGGGIEWEFGLLPAAHAAAGWATRAGALALLGALMPDQFAGVVGSGRAAAPALAAACALHAALPAAGAVRARLLGATRRAADQQQPQPGHSISSSSTRIKRRRTSAAAAAAAGGAAALGAARALAGPAAALAAGVWLWGVVHPSSQAVMRALVALFAVSCEYNSLARGVASGRVAAGADAEAAWRRLHRRAARRVAPHMGDLPPSPPLRPLLQALERTSAILGVACAGGFGGCGLVDGASPGGSTQGLISGGCWWLVEPPPGINSGSIGGGSGGGAQLRLLASVDAAPRPERAAEAASELSRAQLLELFYGPGAAAAAASDGDGSAAGQLGLTAAERAALAPVGVARAPAAVAIAAAPLEADAVALLEPEAAAEATPAAVAAAVAAAAALAANARPPKPPAASLTMELPLWASLPMRPGPDDAAAAAATGACTPCSSVRDADAASLGDGSAFSADAVLEIASPASGASKAASVVAAGAHDDGDGPAVFPWAAPLVAPQSASSSEAAAPLAVAALDRVPALALAATSSSSSTAGEEENDPLAFLQSLPLYGRADHASSDADGSSNTAAAAAAAPLDALLPEWVPAPARPAAVGAALAGRAAYLATYAFGPFLAIGVPLLALAALLGARAAGLAAEADGLAAASGRDRSARARAAQALAAARGALVALLAAALVALLARSSSGISTSGAVGNDSGADTNAEAEAEAARCRAAARRLRAAAWALLRRGCAEGGPSFIKWGQWASSRRDLVPGDLAAALAALQDRAPTHSAAHTEAAVRAAFGRPPGELFEEFDPVPVASGSIAQVHRATLRAAGADGAGSSAALVPVAVKVRHPNVAARLAADFKLLALAADALGRGAPPALRAASATLRQSVAQFTATMTAQADLRVEAVHALRFANNFAGVRAAIAVPRPVPGLAAAEAYAMEWFDGPSVQRCIAGGAPAAARARVVALGVDAYVQMLLRDFFVHSDLHAGNIKVAGAGAGAHDGSGSSSGGGSGDEGEGGSSVQLVLLDFGLAEALDGAARLHFVSFLNHIAGGDGRAAARHLLAWAPPGAPPPDAAAVAADMAQLFARHADPRGARGADLGAVLRGVLQIARARGLSVASRYASLAVSVMTITGFAAELDAKLNVMDAAAPALLGYALTGRALGRLHAG